MIIRIVRMHFRPEEASTFLAIFHNNMDRIRHFPGCTHLELLKDVHSPSVFSTLSYWEKAEDLEAYRKSALFQEVWGGVKPLFSARPEAFSFIKFIEVGEVR